MATSPNGRFEAGARAISNQALKKLEAIGKNLFAFFEGDHVVHVHFGMSGKWAIFDKEQAPEPTPTTRLRLEDEDYVTHLSAMIVKLGSLDLYLDRRRALGQDPLREDADAELLWEKVRGSKKRIGQLLMDQSCFAGVGNIYRAEILFKSGVNPNRSALDISRAEFDCIWQHTVELLQRGFASGSILTVDKEEAERLQKPGLRRYIYNRSRCGRCDGPVMSWDMNSRTCYACPSCQPLRKGHEVKGVCEGKVFQSHCARDSLAERLKTPEKLSVAELRAELTRLGVVVKGRKQLLIDRYKEVIAETEEKAEAKTAASLRKLTVKQLKARLEEAGQSTKGKKEVLINRLCLLNEKVEASSNSTVKKEGTRAVKPGKKHIKVVASAEAAADEKRLAGEKRNVEHVAEDERSMRLRRRREKKLST